MIDARKLTAEIIDIVESQIHNTHPWILDQIQEAEPGDVMYDEENKTTLLHGADYFILEDEITRLVQEALDAEVKLAKRSRK